MLTPKEEKLEQVKSKKETAAEIWFIGMSISALLGIIYGFTNSHQYLVTSLAGFVFITFACMMWVNKLEERQEELEDDIKIEKLEKKIDQIRLDKDKNSDN